MFNDFHESTRNVGVFGALLGLFLLAGLTGLGMAVYSGMENSPDKKVPLSTKVADQKSTIARHQTELSETGAKLTKFEALASIAGEVGDAQIALDLEEQQISKLESLKTKLNSDLAAEEEAFNAYRNRYRIAERKKAEGEILDLSETKGDGYKECTVTAVSPIHLRIMRSTGSEGIPYEQLPAALKDRFQFSEDEAEGYRAVLKKATAVREKQQDRWDEKEKADQADQARIDLSNKAAQNEITAAAKRREADQHRASSAEFTNKANQYRTEAALAKASGQITSKDGLARQADAKASRFTKSALDADKEAAQLETEAAELRASLEALPANE